MDRNPPLKLYPSLIFFALVIMVFWFFRPSSGSSIYFCFCDKNVQYSILHHYNEFYGNMVKNWIYAYNPFLWSLFIKNKGSTLTLFLKIVNFLNLQKDGIFLVTILALDKKEHTNICIVIYYKIIFYKYASHAQANSFSHRPNNS